jgi:hypothetical protein
MHALGVGRGPLVDSANSQRRRESACRREDANLPNSVSCSTTDFTLTATF